MSVGSWAVHCHLLIPLRSNECWLVSRALLCIIFLQLVNQPLGDECWLVSHALLFFSFPCWVMSVGLWAMHYFEEIFELWVLVLTFVLCNECWLVSYALPWHFSNECYLVSNTLPRYNFWAMNICYYIILVHQYREQGFWSKTWLLIPGI